MKLVLLLLLTTAFMVALSHKEKCLSVVTQEDCENMTSEYEKYRECMERRTKRSAGCYDGDDDCDSCNCDTCNYDSYSNCNDCNGNNNCCVQCCQRSSCKTYACCHQTCRAECKSNSCRTSCKKKCQPYITSPGNIREQIRTESKTADSHHNITTVIHLNNVINNTNLINMPVNVNNRVLNNITNEGSSGRYADGTVTTGSKDRCCLTIGPRQCIPQKTFPFARCFHIRKKACGSVCSAPVVHYEKHEICDNDVNVQEPCKQQVIYVPQPQPRCAYQSTWPYVTCGNQELQSCEGCYSHYIKREDVTKCSNFCYDDGYGLGPYYRQGPFYRPGYAHVPSCYQTGTCGMFEGYGYGDGLDYGYEGLSERGFPSAYPPQTYPFVIEDCENCTGLPNWDSPNSHEPFMTPRYENPNGTIQWTQDAGKIINIDASVVPTRSRKYAEIRINPVKKNNLATDAVSTEKSNTTGVPKLS